MNINEIKSYLKKLKRQDKIILFIRDGLSSNLKLPDTKGLIKLLAQNMTDYDPEIFERCGRFPATNRILV
ncbi:MAG: hypothetical protein ACPKPY_00680 [Nitrososphaeraceae archaeon]